MRSRCACATSTGETSLAAIARARSPDGPPDEIAHGRALTGCGSGWPARRRAPGARPARRSLPRLISTSGSRPASSASVRVSPRSWASVRSMSHGERFHGERIAAPLRIDKFRGAAIMPHMPASETAVAEITDWITRFEAAVRARDFATGRALFAPDAVAFGTFAAAVVRARQYRARAVAADLAAHPRLHPRPERQRAGGRRRGLDRGGLELRSHRARRPAVPPARAGHLRAGATRAAAGSRCTATCRSCPASPTRSTAGGASPAAPG